MAYVYRHIRLDKNVPFYIGIGKDKYLRRAYMKELRSKFWYRVVNKTNYEVDIIMEDIDYECAKTKEKEFIKLYGRADLGLGTLVNLTDGGEGNTNWSPAQREKHIKNRTGKKASEETKKRLSESHKGIKPTEEARENMRKAQKMKVISKETREKMAAKLRGRPQPEWQRKILSEAAKGKKVYWCYKPVESYIGGKIAKEYESITAAAKDLNLCVSNIQKVLYGRRQHTGGYFFKFK